MLCLLILIFLFCSLYAADENYLITRQVGPGIFFHHEFRAEGPWHLYVLEIDRTNPWLQIKTAKARDLLAAHEKTSSMSMRNDKDGHRIVGAINGDFYDGEGIPVGAQVLNGILLKSPETRSVFGIDVQGIPFIDILHFSGSIFDGNGNGFPIDGINEAPSESKVVVYNSYYGNYSDFDDPLTKIICQKIGKSDTSVNDSISVKAIAVEHSADNLVIPDSGLVIAFGSEIGERFGQKIRLGDTLAVLYELRPGNRKISELIGGIPRLIHDGEITVEWEQENVSEAFTYNRHPRTALGISADTSRIFFFTVDGRQEGYSVGMSLFELAEYMLGWKVEQGINLDGGGSTTMVVRGQVVNRPSDLQGERAVSNAVMVVSRAPQKQIIRMELQPDALKILNNTSLRFSATGYDEFFNPVTLDGNDLDWSCGQQIGKINKNGDFIAGTEANSGFVYGCIDRVCDSVKLRVTEAAKLQIDTPHLPFVIGEEYQFKVTAFDKNKTQLFTTPTSYRWFATESIGRITAHGEFQALRSGDGYVIARSSGVSDSIKIAVRGLDNHVIDKFDSVKHLTWDGSFIDSNHCKIYLEDKIFVSPPFALKIDYGLEKGGTSIFNINFGVQIQGHPDRIGFSVYGNEAGHHIAGEFSDADGERFILHFTDAEDNVEQEKNWRYLQHKFNQLQAHWSNRQAVPDFPITLNKLYLSETEREKKDRGTLLLDDLQVGYFSEYP